MAAVHGRARTQASLCVELQGQEKLTLKPGHVFHNLRCLADSWWNFNYTAEITPPRRRLLPLLLLLLLLLLLEHEECCQHASLRDAVSLGSCVKVPPNHRTQNDKKQTGS